MPIRRIAYVLLVIILTLSLSGCQLLDSILGPLTNKAPIALIQASQASGPAALTVSFDGSASYDPDGMILTYQWAFGDGQTGQGQQVAHTFTEPGQYLTTLTVTDEKGATGRDQTQIEVTQSPAGASLPLIDHAIAKDVQNGSPAGATRTFTPPDGRVYVWFKVGPGSGQHTSSVEWYTPQGALYVTSTDQPTGFGQIGSWNSVSLWHWMDLQTPQGNATQAPSAFPGTWQIEIYIDGQHLLSDSFQLAAATSSAGPCNVVQDQPVSVVEGARENNSQILVFEEQVYHAYNGQTIPVDVAVDRLPSGPATFDQVGDLVPGQLQNMSVYSYFVHLDPVGHPASAQPMQCVLTFGEPIVGIILTDAKLDSTDGTLGFYTAYPTGMAHRGIDLGINDRLTLAADRYHITIDFNPTDGVDSMRVVTLMGVK